MGIKLIRLVELIQRAEDFEQLAMRRLEKIQLLEKQVRQHVYSLAKKKMPPGEVAKHLDDHLETSTVESDADTNILLSDLIDEKGGDIQPDENLLEVWVKGATLDDKLLVPGSSTFVVIDFFDYESQATSLVNGKTPQWDFAATFKLSIDDFLLRYFALDVITFELNMVRNDTRSTHSPSLPTF